MTDLAIAAHGGKSRWRRRGEFPSMIGDKGECSVILVYDYDSCRFVANGAAEGESAARSGIEESL